jgi:hypothetical protein
MKKFTTLALATAMTAAMACTAFADSTISGFTADTGDWASSFADGDFIDANTFTKDTALDVTVNYTLDTSKEYWLLAPAQANGWAKLNANGYISNIALKDESTQQDDGTWVDASGNAVSGVMQSDGFIVLGAGSTSVSFTISADGVNALISGAADDFDGLLFQIYGVEVTSVTLSQDGVKLNSKVGTEEEETPAPAEDNSGANDGDVAPVAYLAAVVALAGAAMVASKKVRA